MREFLLFCAVCLGMFSLVPLSVLAATGSWRQTWGAMRGYCLCLGVVLVIPMAAGSVIGLLLNLF